jgi:putative ABC transport system ATP-binding protein
LLPDITALQNVEVPLRLARAPSSEIRTRAFESLQRVELSNRANHLPEALSGGEQQRVAIARALVGRPGILLADEPTGALDSEAGRAALDLLLRLREEAGTTLVIVTHEPSVVERCRRVVRLLDGRVVDC